MHETTFRRIRLPLRTVGVPCLRIAVAPLPAANAAIGDALAREVGQQHIEADDAIHAHNGADISGES